MDYNAANSGDKDAQLLTTGTVFANAAGVGCTLNINTFIFAIGSADAPVPAQCTLTSIHLKWAAAVAGTITIETCNFPAIVGGLRTGPADVTDFDSTAGNWIQENPSSAVVSVTGAGNSFTALTGTMGGTNAGGCTIHLGNVGMQRIRVKVVVTVGGVVRCNVHGKQGA